MTTVTDSALARFSASIQNRSSMKLSLAGKAVDCTRYTRRPRTVSLTRTNRLPSEKRSTSPVPGCTCTYSQILRVSFGLPLPPKMRMSSATRQLLRPGVQKHTVVAMIRIDWREPYLPAEHVDHLPVAPGNGCRACGSRPGCRRRRPRSSTHSALAGPFESISCSVNGPLLARARVVRLEKPQLHEPSRC